MSLSKIELHKLEYHNGGMTPLSYRDLNDDDLAIISRAIFSRIATERDRDYDEVMSDVLREWGIVCPHPVHRRAYDRMKIKSATPLSQFRWFFCECCSMNSRNEYWVPSSPVTENKKETAG